jgi:hypothetical protein
LSSKISRSSFFQFGPSSDFQDSMIQLQFPKYFSFILQAMHSSMQQFIYVTSQVLATPSITHSQPSIVSLPPLTRPIMPCQTHFLKRRFHYPLLICPLHLRHFRPHFIPSTQHSPLLSNSIPTDEVQSTTPTHLFSSYSTGAPP